MEEKIKRIYIPMTETGFYILYCLQQQMHGYGIGQTVREEEKRKCYSLTDLGQEILNLELQRIERLYRNSKGEYLNGK